MAIHLSQFEGTNRLGPPVVPRRPASDSMQPRRHRQAATAAPRPTLRACCSRTQPPKPPSAPGLAWWEGWCYGGWPRTVKRAGRTNGPHTASHHPVPCALVAGQARLHTYTLPTPQGAGRAGPNRTRPHAVCAAAAVAATTACAAPAPPPTPSSTPTIMGAPKLEVNTSMGAFTVELYVAHAPKTCKNFVELAKRGYYDGVTVGLGGRCG